jgi:hypothetical protein
LFELMLRFIKFGHHASWIGACLTKGELRQVGLGHVPRATWCTIFDLELDVLYEKLKTNLTDLEFYFPISSTVKVVHCNVIPLEVSFLPAGGIELIGMEI